jgi:hypothetical protein
VEKIMKLKTYMNEGSHYPPKGYKKQLKLKCCCNCKFAYFWYEEEIYCNIDKIPINREVYLLTPRVEYTSVCPKFMQI